MRDSRSLGRPEALSRRRLLRAGMAGSAGMLLGGGTVDAHDDPAEQADPEDERGRACPIYLIGSALTGGSTVYYYYTSNCANPPYPAGTLSSTRQLNLGCNGGDCVPRFKREGPVWKRLSGEKLANEKAPDDHSSTRMHEFDNKDPLKYEMGMYKEQDGKKTGVRMPKDGKIRLTARSLKVESSAKDPFDISRLRFLEEPKNYYFKALQRYYQLALVLVHPVQDRDGDLFIAPDKQQDRTWIAAGIGLEIETPDKPDIEVQDGWLIRDFDEKKGEAIDLYREKDDLWFHVLQAMRS